MAAIYDQFVMSGTTTTSTTAAAILGSVIGGLDKYDWFTVDASLVGAPVGTLDVYLQRRVQTTAQQSGGVWADWMHFPQLTAGASRVYYSGQSLALNALTVVGRGTDASAGTPALAANTSLGGHPGEALRLVTKSGTRTMTGAALVVVVNAWGRRL